MGLSTGDKLGPYEILAPLGAGGMGEVYRARDTQLDREVAIKVLPHAMASDPERLARFDREAKILAALNHPNIAVIYGLVESGGRRALVMELVPGETLGERIKRGALPVEEACKIASQVAEALEAAHEKNVVHRDLKPGNVMITPSGSVKVLDFGLAAMAAPAQAPGDAEASPTLTMGMTQAGMIMGTAAYMSPEQAAGLPVDKRSDIWSFGVVLWEMLTGKRLFGGATISHTLADVLRAPIDFDAVKAPAPIKNLLRRCLDREARTRLRDVGEARVAIAEYLAKPEELLAAPSRSGLGRPNGMWAGWVLAGLALAGASFLGWKLWSGARAADGPLIRLNVELGPEATRGRRVSATLSPDGTRIIYSGRAGGGLTQLYTRRMDQAVSTLLPGSDILDPSVFFSPNGEWFGFTNIDGKIKKMAAQGGAAVTLGPMPGESLQVVGASWGDDDNIILGTTVGLWRMPGSGGTAQRVTKQGVPQVFPQVLPGGKAVLFNSFPAANSRTINLEDLEVDAMPFDTGQSKTLVQGGYWARYLPTSSDTGHLIYMHEGTLFGVGFDPRGLKLLGTPVPLLDDVAASTNASEGGGQFAFSNNGTFVYLSGRARSASYTVSWLDAAGKTTPLVAQAGAYGAPRLSPDGKRLAYLASSSKGSDVWVYDVERGTSTQLTFLGSVGNEVAWARDSKHLVYCDIAALWWIRADGAGQRQLLLDKASNPRPSSFAPDGRLVYSPSLGSLPDVWTIALDLSDPEHPKPGKPEPFLADPALVEVDPAFSPDGKFIAYASNESGDEQVFVRPFPGPGGKWRVSVNGGKFPHWSAATHELFFLGGEDRIMAAAYTTQGDSFNAGTPRVWSPTQIRRTNVQQNFDVAPDGKRVVMFPRPAAEENGGPLHATFLLNFFDEVRRRVPMGK